jgi:hypothetical protein
LRFRAQMVLLLIGAADAAGRNTGAADGAV